MPEFVAAHEPLMALFGHGAMSDLGPLCGVIQTSHFKGVRTVFDPRTSLIISGFRLGHLNRCRNADFRFPAHWWYDAGKASRNGK
jgi:hypothetical protein